MVAPLGRTAALDSADVGATGRRTRRPRRRALAAVGSLAAAALVLTACTQSEPVSNSADDDSAVVQETPTPTPEPAPELPGGGRSLFPEYRLVGYSGIVGDPSYALGRLSGDLDQKCREIKRLGGGTYEKGGRKVMPTFEFIPVIVHPTPQSDGTFRTRAPYKDVRTYLKAARRCDALLLLNIQPGRSEFMPEMKHYEKFLKEPDVGVALDPEWAMDPGEIPGRSLGRSTGKELNQAAKYLADIVEENNLPEKAMVFHQFNLGAVENLGKLKAHDGVAIIRSVDGLGGPEIKKDEYDMLATDLPEWIHPGFKLFYTEDVHSEWGSRLMTPKEVMRLRPRPEYVLYE